MRYSKIAGLLAFCLFGSLACDKQEPERTMTPASSPAMPSETTEEPGAATQPWKQVPAPRPTTQAGISGVADNDKSSKLIAMVRCEREQRCNNVGEEGQYVTQEDCVVSLEPDTRGELDSRVCPSGIQAVELDECVEQIRNADCSSQLPDIELVAECRNEELCVD
jgi:hypothetical protein